MGFCSFKKNKIMLFARKWMEWKIIVLAEARQTSNKKYHVFFHIWKWHESQRGLLGLCKEMGVRGKRRGDEYSTTTSYSMWFLTRSKHFITRNIWRPNFLYLVAWYFKCTCRYLKTHTYIHTDTHIYIHIFVPHLCILRITIFKVYSWQFSSRNTSHYLQSPCFTIDFLNLFLLTEILYSLIFCPTPPLYTISISLPFWGLLTGYPST